MSANEKYGGWDGAHGLEPRPGDPNYVSVEEATRRQLAFNLAYEARPEIIEKRARDRESEARLEAEKNAKRKRPKLIQSTDYPWLKPDWVEGPVRTGKR
jgi:hypothetical protein